MSKEDQTSAQVAVQRIRTMTPIANAPQGRATLVQRCTTSLQEAQKNDTYGCYKP